jgi:hypothetical protein
MTPVTQRTPEKNDLLDVLVDPQKLAALAAPRQSMVVRQARHAGLLGYLAARLEAENQTGRLADHLHGARVHAEFFDSQIAWETRCADRALQGLDGPVVLLKGAAYRALEMGLSKGRLASDVDLLLPREQLPAAEALLEADGWAPIKEDDYEQHYYREWMHELPPLRHQDRGTVIDLHHNILPPTARFKPDARKLLDAAVPIPGTSLYALSPADNVLHRCAHLFVDGDLHNSLRELMDIYGLLRLYEEDASFRDTLLPRARELQLQRPLSYALYFCARLLQWHPPAEWARETDRRVGPVQTLTRTLMEQQLLPSEPGTSTLMHRVSAWLLFLRSHWLRMPPLMLTRHLLHQVRARGGLKTGG